MCIRDIYQRLDERLTTEDFWWLYVTLKHRFMENDKFKQYVTEDVKATGQVAKIILNSVYGSHSFHSKPTIKKVIFNPPATVIIWSDGTKSVVKCQNGEEFDAEKGFALAYLKKLLGNDNTFNKEINKWVYDD